MSFDLGLKGEDKEQSDLIQWARKESRLRPELEMLVHVPNGGWRGMSAGMKMKALGVRAGYPDLLMDVARGDFFGLRIEMKDGEKGVVSNLQELWMKRLSEEGYRVEICRSFEEAKNVILNYLSFKPTKRKI